MDYKKAIPLTFMLIGSMMLNSCYQEIERVETSTRSQVEISLKGFHSTLTRAHSLEDTSVKRISFSVFDQEENEVEHITQKDTDEDFGQIHFLLQEGDYTFVAVAHGIHTATAPCATIRSATEVQLPETFLCDTYTLVEQHTISGNKKVTITMELQQAVAHVHAISDDIVPVNVKAVGFNVNLSGEKLTDSNLPLINPSTGLAPRSYAFTYNLLATLGDPYDREFYILLTSEAESLPLTLTVFDTTNKLIDEYTRELISQPFQRGYTTTLTGTIFSSYQNGSFVFDGDLGIITGTLDNF